jgi:hypothetical protein
MAEDKSLILQDVKDLAERESVLRENAVRKEEVPIKIEFSQEELEDITTKQVAIAIFLEKEEARKKEFMDEWNDSVKPKKSDQRLLLKELDQGFKWIDMMLYAIQNFEDNTMDYYNPEGMLMHSRALLDSERQAMI